MTPDALGDDVTRVLALVALFLPGPDARPQR
jgi:hypothetical protein